MTMNLSSPEETPSEFVPLSSKEGRVQDAELIRLDFIRSKGRKAVPPVDSPAAQESNQNEK
jgi:hypothetical protein